MFKLLRTAILFFAAMTILLGVVYPLAVTGLAQALFPHQANGSLTKTADGRTASTLIGQPFASPRYFRGRPSATAPYPYNAASSGGSNLGPSNQALYDAVEKRIAALKAADPGNERPVPVDLVTASGSGLDPHISPAAALYQVHRVAKARGLAEGTVEELVRRHVRDRAFGILGEPTVNVLELNMALDAVR